jgi:signal transduction histidine kinase
MRSQHLKTRILLSFGAVIFVLAVSIALLGRYVINKDIVERANDKLSNDLRAARSVYETEIERLGWAFGLVDTGLDCDQLKSRMQLDYLVKVGVEDISEVRSEIALKAYSDNHGVGGTRIIGVDELVGIGSNLGEERKISIKFTPRARDTQHSVVEGLMSKEYARPLYGEKGEIVGLIYGGRIINRDYGLVDRIRSLAFGNELYESKPLGTVTIFQGDIRISTNVLNDDGSRAIGTRVSEEVYDKVIEKGQVWHQRAFVVNEWHMTAYEPIRNIEGEVIGILYVGTIEEPFVDMAERIMLMFGGIVAAASVLSVIVAFIVAGAVSRPLVDLRDATHKLSGGDLGYEVSSKSAVKELNELAESFNSMSGMLSQREKSLNITNAKLEALNKSYVDLIGFVAHELKGILASAIINAYSVRDGLLGMINFKQRKAMDSVTRNMDYLEATVKKFLNLGRVERGELPLHKVEVNLRKGVFDLSIGALAAVHRLRKIEIHNEIDAELTVEADADLMLVVANNLLSNAIKYGIEDGKVVISSREVDGKVGIEVYNDSEPITEDQKSKLFKKFSRLDTAITKRVKGTGLGLYITRQIIEAHGGRIWVESREHGNSFIFEIERV